MIGAGEYTNSIAFGGRNGGPDAKLANAETWNGTSWTEVNDLNTAREQLGGAGLSSTSALAFGGEGPPFKANTEDWNGASWSETSDLPTATQNLSSNGTATAAVAASGQYLLETQQRLIYGMEVHQQLRY